MQQRGLDRHTLIWLLTGLGLLIAVSIGWQRICSIVLKKSVVSDSYPGRTEPINTDLFLLTLGVRIQKAGDRF